MRRAQTTDPSTDGLPRRLLADYLLTVADWRCIQMRRYPYDARQARAADGLLALARYVADLPEEDERPRRLIRAGRVDRFGFSPRPAIDDAVMHFRLDAVDEPVDAFLSRLVRVARADRRRAAAEDPAVETLLGVLAVTALKTIGHDPDRALELLVHRLARRRPEDALVADLPRPRLARAVEGAMPRAWLEDGG
jgi:hypothetical protein